MSCFIKEKKCIACNSATIGMSAAYKRISVTDIRIGWFALEKSQEKKQKTKQNTHTLHYSLSNTMQCISIIYCGLAAK